MPGSQRPVSIEEHLMYQFAVFIFFQHYFNLLVCSLACSFWCSTRTFFLQMDVSTVEPVRPHPFAVFVAKFLLYRQATQKRMMYYEQPEKHPIHDRR